MRALAAGLLLLAAAVVLPPATAHAPSVSRFAWMAAAAQPGDLVFRRSGGMWAEAAAAFSHRDRRFSHVGIVAQHGRALVVVHAAGDPVSRDARVRAEPFEDFLASSTDAALYRVDRVLPARNRIAGVALGYAAERRPFDRDFSLAEGNALYCTELVWRAVRTATGLDLAPRKSMAMGRAYVALDDLFLHRAVVPVRRQIPSRSGQTAANRVESGATAQTRE